MNFKSIFCCYKQPSPVKPLTDKEKAIANFVKYSIDTPPLSLQGMATWCRVIDIYDGDTLTILLPFHNIVNKFSVRLNGIDTCEIKSTTEANKAIAVFARNRLVELIIGSSIGSTNQLTISQSTRKDIRNILKDDVYVMWVECGGMDKYGRVLVDLYQSPEKRESVSSILLRENLAYIYKGKKKLTDTEQIQFFTNNNYKPK